MATPKKGQGINFVLPDAADATAPKEATASAAPPPSLPRTGVGVLARMISGAHAESEAVSALNAQVERLKLQVGEQLLDPKTIALTRWADRHPDSFASPQFEELKRDIASAGGNIQPIKVRPLPISGSSPAGAGSVKYELVFGSRRTRACLELGLPVRAVVDDGVDDRQLYVQMQRENRARANLSAWEQGVSYRKAIAEGLFPTQLALSQAIGVDASNLTKALRIADLPGEVVGAFQSPLDIQFRWAAGLARAYEQNPAAVMDAARHLTGLSPRPSGQAVFQALTAAGARKPKQKTKTTTHAFELASGKKGVIRVNKGGAVTVELARGALPQERLVAFEERLRKLLAELSEGS